MTHPSPQFPAAPLRASAELFLISLLILLLELACIRWFSAHVLFLTFFTNTVLLAAFLGMSAGCLCAKRSTNFLAATPMLLAFAMLAAYTTELVTDLGGYSLVDVGNQASPQVVYFGAEHASRDLSQFRVPAEVINAFFFLLIALVFVGPGQRLGMALDAIPNRIRAYTINIVGSLAGILVFSGLSAWQASPVWWFVPVVAGLGYFLLPTNGLKGQTRQWVACALLLTMIPVVAGAHSVLGHTGLPARWGASPVTTYWSPYYRVDYRGQPDRAIAVNLIGHQSMVGRHEKAAVAYAMPYALNRDAGGQPFQDVLIIGAGSGNDVSQALSWVPRSVDAVEIDPVIYQLGAQDHPDQPYDDPRVSVYLDDGRNYLRSTDKSYDLIVYALVDSLVLHSGYSNLRLESYLFTRQAFEDVKRRLKPGGRFVMYNFFRQGWIVARIQATLREVFGDDVLVFSLPYRTSIKPDDNLEGHFTIMMAGNTSGISEAFAGNAAYWIENVPLDKGTERPNGFAIEPKPGQWQNWSQMTPAAVAQSLSPLQMATDEWPFLYVRSPMIPAISLRGIALMGMTAVGLLVALRPRGARGKGTWPADMRMFFLGAGFMLVETKAVVQLALVFGSTWVVNSVVFAGVLVMILVANLLVLAVGVRRLWPYYGGLFAALGVNLIVPLDSFLGMSYALQVALAGGLVLAPILFAGVIFAASFADTANADRAFGFNIAGAMVGGLAENVSLLLGFQLLTLVAVGFYLLSLVGSLSVPKRQTADSVAVR